MLFQRTDELLPVGGHLPQSHLALAPAADEVATVGCGGQRRDTLVVGVVDGVDEATGERSEGADYAVVPRGEDRLAVVREHHAGAAEVGHADAEQLLHGAHGPDAHVVLSGSCEDLGEVPKEDSRKSGPSTHPTCRILHLLRECDVVDGRSMTRHHQFPFKIVHADHVYLRVGRSGQDLAFLLHELDGSHRRIDVRGFEDPKRRHRRHFNIHVRHLPHGRFLHYFQGAVASAYYQVAVEQKSYRSYTWK